MNEFSLNIESKNFSKLISINLLCSFIKTYFKKDETYLKDNKNV